MSASWEIREGDCIERMAEMSAASINCCVTSPPYFGLRDYGTASWEGGDPRCEHGVRRWEGEKQTQGAQSGHASAADRLARTECSCGARRVDRQIGLEPTVDAYVERLVEVFRAVKRVLRDDGTLWLNLGDSYAGGGNGARDPDRWPKQSRNNGGDRVQHAKKQTGAKPKDLLGVPWMVAFALRADGWYLRSDIIWSKPNPMPESVSDRPSNSHEHIFLLSKSARYFYNAEAIRELDKGTDHKRSVLHRPEPSGGIAPPNAGIRRAEGRNGAGRNKRAIWKAAEDEFEQFLRWKAEQPVRPDWWELATQPYPDAHFATFPPKLIEPMVLAGCPAGGTVLDPFAGSGTTLQVAVEHGRNAVGIELSPAYCELVRRRLGGVTSPLPGMAA